MNSILKKKDLVYRKLKISDYSQLVNYFYSCFKRNVSYEFYKARYFSDKYTFCYGVFLNSELIANVGMVSMKLNNNKKEIIFSRHSSMVIKKHRGKGIFSYLLKKIKIKISSKVKRISL